MQQAITIKSTIKLGKRRTKFAMASKIAKKKIAMPRTMTMSMTMTTSTRIELTMRIKAEMKMEKVLAAVVGAAVANDDGNRSLHRTYCK